MKLICTYTYININISTFLSKYTATYIYKCEMNILILLLPLAVDQLESMNE